MKDHAAHAHPHAVQFYGDSGSLCRRVATFLTAGLEAGEPAIVIANSEHRDCIVTELEARLVDVAHARRAGELVLLDSEDTLGACMVGGSPDPTLFHSYMSTVLGQVARGRR